MINEEDIQEIELANPKALKKESFFEATLRPQILPEYIGQNKIKDSLKILIGASKKRGETLEHVMLYGPPGLGKTTLAHIIAHEMGSQIKVTSGPAIEKAGDLASILTNLSNNDVLFIDEIHRLNKVVEEILYPAMEDYCLDIILGKGAGAKALRIDLPKFTLIGATTRVGLVSSPLRDRFGATFRLDYYEEDEIGQILDRAAKILNVEIDEPAKREVAKRSRRTPRIANRLLKRVRDFAQVKAAGKVTQDIAKKALNMLEVDDLGLDANDRRMLLTIIEKFAGGPVGISSLAAATSEEADTIEDIHEPYLLRLGFLVRTPKGRMATPAAYDHLKKTPKQQANQTLL